MKKILLLCSVLFFTGYTLLAQTTIFTQNFEGSWTTPPTLSPAWSGTSSPADNVWHRNDYTTGWSGSSGSYSPTGANSTTYSARFHSYDASSGTTGDLITPVIDLSTYTSGVNFVDFYYINASGSDKLDVYVSTDNDSTWSASKLTLTTASSWTKNTVNLGSTSATTLIKFTATSDWGVSDIGVDEVVVYNLIPPPTITVTPFGNTSSLAPRTLTATITSTVGIPASGIGLPQLYWKKNAGSWSNVQAVSLGGNQYSFTFGNGVAVGDVIYYYIVAQDAQATPLFSASPSAGASGFTANPPACSTPPTSPYIYKVVGELAGGNYLIGGTGTTPAPGCTYVDLSAAIADINPCVASITVTNGGSGYTSAPTVSFSGGDGGVYLPSAKSTRIN